MFFGRKENTIRQHVREVMENYVRPYRGVKGYPVHDLQDPVYIGLVSIIAKLNQFYYPDQEAIEMVNKYVQSEEFQEIVSVVFDYGYKPPIVITKKYDDGVVEIETIKNY